MAFPARGDEGRHAPTGHPWWEEAWHLDFATADASFGGHVRLGILPNQGVSWVWAAVVGDGRRLVTVVEHEAPIPRPGALDLRCEGLWTDFVCEEALDHWSVGLEAFGVALDEPDDALRGLRGERVGVGFDLGWETVGEASGDPRGARYHLDCDVAGEVLVGDEVVTFDGWGSRDHTWGVSDRGGAAATTGAGSGRLDDGTRWHVDGGIEAGGSADPGPPPTGGRIDDAVPVLRHRVRHRSPVPVATADGNGVVVLHGLCTTSAADGRTGAAWLRWDLPGSSAASP